MSTSPAHNTDVLIIGAGLTGLVLALWLARMGIRVRIIDRTAQAGTTSRALAVQARTLELYNQIGLADAVVERGRKVPAANFWVSGKKVGRFALADFGAGLSPFPYMLVFPQDEHERLLIDRLTRSGVEVERRTELVDFEDTGGRIRARLKSSDEAVQECEAAYIAGCDGAHSAVREALKIGFPGGTYEHVFYVADVAAKGPATNGEVHVGLDTADFLAVFPLKSDGYARLVGTVREARPRNEDLSWNDVSKRVIDWMGIEVERVNWFSTYHVHHRVADHFRKGRAFLLGDAAHVHSPVGGQGMNTGIGDAINLAWKLTAVLKGRADASLLDSYEPERIAFARRLVATTDSAFTGVTSSGAVARRVRMQIVPLMLPLLTRFRAVRRLMFRAVSQIAVNYRASPLSEGRAGAVHGGDRLPWMKNDDGVKDNFAPLTSLDWQVHVYGEAPAEIRALCAERNLRLYAVPWRLDMDRSGLRRDAVYLVRPDGYVATAASERGAEKVASYLEARKLVALSASSSS